MEGGGREGESSGGGFLVGVVENCWEVIFSFVDVVLAVISDDIRCVISFDASILGSGMMINKV